MAGGKTAVKPISSILKDDSRDQFRTMLTLQDRMALKRDVETLVSEVKDLTSNRKLVEQSENAGNQINRLVDESGKRSQELLQVGELIESHLMELSDAVLKARNFRISELYMAKGRIEGELIEKDELFALQDELSQGVVPERKKAITGRLKELEGTGFAPSAEAKALLKELEGVNKELSELEEKVRPTAQEEAQAEAQNREYQQKVSAVLGKLKPLQEKVSIRKKKLDDFREHASSLDDEYFKKADPLKDERRALQKKLDEGAKEDEEKLRAEIARLTQEIELLAEERNKKLEGIIAEIESVEGDLEKVEGELKSATKEFMKELDRVSEEVFSKGPEEESPSAGPAITMEQYYGEIKPLQFALERAERLSSTVKAAMQAASIQANYAKEKIRLKEDKLREEEEDSRLLALQSEMDASALNAA